VDSTRLDTIYVVADYGHPSENLLARADAIAFLGRGIGGVWNVAKLLNILPKWAGNRAYNLVARHRYSFFGKHESCPLPDERDRQKFLG
jgi:predicted DCC family thiol-disulfide oxidoreductase YuxK